jgi:Dienelactone hydrolase family
LAGVDLLGSDPRVNGSIAALGDCFGGRTLLELARNGADLAAAVSVHGSLETVEPARPGEVKAKIRGDPEALRDQRAANRFGIGRTDLHLIDRLRSDGPQKPSLLARSVGLTIATVTTGDARDPSASNEPE